MPSVRTQQIVDTRSYVRVLMTNVLNLSADPAEGTMMYATLQTMFRQNPERFSIISGIHKNNEYDPLHFSVEVEIGTGFRQRFHFNMCQIHGSNKLRCYNIVGYANNKRTNRRYVETIATFRM